MLRVVVFCLLTLALVGCGSSDPAVTGEAAASGSQMQPAAKADKSGKTLSDCEAETIIVVKVGCYTEAALAENDETICERIEKPVTGRNNCYNELAQAKTDADICGKIEGDQMQVICLSRLGAKIGDCDVCDQIESDLWSSQCREACKQN